MSHLKRVERVDTMAAGQNLLISLHPDLVAKIEKDGKDNGRNRNKQIQFKLLEIYGMEPEKYLVEMEKYPSKTGKRPLKNGKKSA